MPFNLLEDESLAPLLAASIEIEPAEAVCRELGPAVPAGVARGLESLGIGSLYSHQRQSLDAVAAGKNVVVATPAASGKSLCYILPVIADLHRDPDGAAIFLFPTKALSRDQEKTIAALLEASGTGAPVVTYDGDTPKQSRKYLRRGRGIVITNPDMLHASLLPRHTAWAGLFSSLKYIVIDEIHQYRGVFGCHVANVLRRLRRILNFYGADPVWIAASATIGNPLEIARSLTGLDFELIGRSTAPSPGRVLQIFNTPLLSRLTGLRQSYLRLTSKISASLIRGGLQTIVFANSRSGVEMLVRHIKSDLKETEAGKGSGGEDNEAVKGYRGGYLPGLRRSIEKELKSGQLRCVVATSALELGIDIGRLDAVVMAGYPGTISGLWQRVGRVGRRRRKGIAVLVASGSPLDQFLVNHADYITRANPESCYINPDNLEIMIPHLRCALSEVPFEVGESFARMESSEMREILDFFVSEGSANLSGEKYYWIAGGSPSRDVSLRTSGSRRMRMMETREGRLIEEIEETRVLGSLHPGAVYQHAGEQYEVTGIDFENLVVDVREIAADYYTEPIIEDRLSIIDEFDTREAGGATACLGEIRLTRKVTGYKCIRFATNEVVSAHEADMPQQQMEACALWLKARGDLLLPDGLAGRAAAESIEEALSSKHPATLLMDGLGGLGYLMCRIAALRLMCDPRDLGSSTACDLAGCAGSEDGREQALGYLYIYEAYQGGVGIAKGFYEAFTDIAGDCLEAALGCNCLAGCPACVGPPGGKSDLRKLSSIILLNAIIKCNVVRPVTGRRGGA
ncbi:MAG: DEAD/DEAH box helicase [Pseudomonadota bacterium]